MQTTNPSLKPVTNFLNFPNDLLKIVLDLAETNGSLSLINKRLNFLVSEVFKKLNNELMNQFPPIISRSQLNPNFSPKKNFQLLMNALHVEAKRIGCDIVINAPQSQLFPFSSDPSYKRMNSQHGIARELVANIVKRLKPFNESHEFFMASFLAHHIDAQIYQEVRNCKKAKDAWKILEEKKVSTRPLGKIQLRGQRVPFLSLEFCSLIHLQKLDLTTNPIRELPTEIGNLINLVKFAAGFCQLKSIPSTIGNLTKLTKLYLDHNQLKEIPESIGNLKALRKLTLESNNIKVLPSRISELSLTEFTIGNNPITQTPGNIPAQSNGQPAWDNNCSIM